MASATPLDEVLHLLPSTPATTINNDTSTLAASQFSHTVTVEGYEIGPKSVVHFTHSPDKINKCCIAAKLLGFFMFLRILVLAVCCTWVALTFFDLKIDLVFEVISEPTKGSIDWFFVPELLYHNNAKADLLYYVIMGTYIGDLLICLIFSTCSLMMDDIKCLMVILSIWIFFQLAACSAYMWGLAEFMILEDYHTVYYADVSFCLILVILMIICIVALCRLNKSGYKSFNDQYQVELRQMYHEQQVLKDAAAAAAAASAMETEVPTDTTLRTSMTDTVTATVTETETSAITVVPTDPLQQPTMLMPLPLIHEPPIQLHVLPDGTPDPNYPYHPPDAYHPSEFHYHHYHQEDIDGWRHSVRPDLQGFLDHQQPAQQHTTTVVVKSKKHHKHHRKKPKTKHHHHKK